MEYIFEDDKELYRDGVSVMDCNPLRAITVHIVNNIAYNSSRIIAYFLQLMERYIHSKWSSSSSMTYHSTLNNRLNSY